MSVTEGRYGFVDEHAATAECATIGNAFVVGFGGALSRQARGVATSVATDPVYDIAVVDLPERPSVRTWEAVVEVIPLGRRRVRVVPVGWIGEAATVVGPWLAERLGRTVAIPDGWLHQGANGCLFVHSWPGSGWLMCQPHQRPVWEAKRFPKPTWDTRAVGEVLATGSSGIAEPIPGGIWIHPVADSDHVDGHRRRLVEYLPSQRDLMTVVVGCPGMPPVPIADIAYVLSCLPREVRPRVRFARYGPVALPHGGDLGSVLAQFVGEPVVCYPGIPLGNGQWPEIHTVLPDGAQGWRAYAREVEYYPPAESAPGRSPVVRTHWLPFAGVTPMDGATYWYAPDAVVEIVQSGLWLRPPHSTVDALAVRSQPCAHVGARVFFDNSTEQNATRMHWLAQDIVGRMPPGIRADTSIVPSRPTGKSECRAAPAADAEPPCSVTRRPAPLREHVQPQLAPEPEAMARVPADGPVAERSWLLANLNLEFQSVEDSVARAVAENVGRWRTGGMSDDGLLTDAVAVRLYLSARGEKVDLALRFGELGPHVPLARCAASGLACLPIHRGAAGYSTPVTTDRLREYREQGVLVDWGFVGAMTEPAVGRVDEVEVLLWSMTGRLTHALEPDGDGRVPGRVLFLPGTRFKVLDVLLPDPDGSGGQVLLRELAVTETDSGADATPGASSLDELAMTSLLAQRRRWAQAATGTEISAFARHRFVDLPGLRPG